MKTGYYINDYDYDLVIKLAERYDIHPVSYDKKLVDGSSIYGENVSWIFDEYEFEIESADFN